MTVIIDNYDSFTYNLYQYVGTITPEVEVYRNDRVTVDKLKKMRPSHVIISPGPGVPSDAGISCETALELGGEIPVLGVCLGHQAIGEAYGGRIVHARKPIHGKPWKMNINTACPIFEGLPETVSGGRYHSLLVERESLPEGLVVTAETMEGEIMGLKHCEYPVFGIQFHPESVLTECGMKIIENFLRIKGR